MWRAAQKLQEQNFARTVRGRKSLVYAYLRESDGTPYYIGVASTSDRPASKYHRVKPPRDRRFIRIPRSDLRREQAWEWEKYFISHYGRKDLGTGILRNQSDGGEGNNGYRHTEETKRRVSESMKGRKQTPEWIKKRASKIRGENNGMFGRQHSEETKAKMSQLRKGVKRGPMSEEAKRKISEAKKGKSPSVPKPKMTPEQIEAHRLRTIEWHRRAQEQRAAARGATVPELLKLEKKERNARSYANWRARNGAAKQEAA
jgi:hypothetical protein